MFLEYVVLFYHTALGHEVSVGGEKEFDRTVSLDTHYIQWGDGMKNTISTILAIAGAIALVLLFGGGMRMSGLASESGNSVAEYYYQAMGTCMIGFSFVAAGLLWGLSWMIAAWPDNEGILAALSRKDSSIHANFTSPSSSESTGPSATNIQTRPLTLEEIELGHQPFYDSLAASDPTAPTVVRQLLLWLRERRATTLWGSGPDGGSIVAYVQRRGVAIEVCTVQSTGVIQIHFESLHSSVHQDSTHLRNLRKLVQTLTGTASSEETPLELLTVPVSLASSADGFSNLAALLQELIRCRSTPDVH